MPGRRHVLFALTGLVLAAAGPADAQSGDPLAGTWTLNVARSRFAGPPPKSQTTRLDAVTGGVREVVDRVNADGSTTHWDVTVMFDGRDTPINGDPSRDTVAFTRVDDRTADVVNKKGGLVVSRMRIVVAPDGRTRTNTVTALDASGRAIESTMVFDRQ